MSRKQLSEAWWCWEIKTGVQGLLDRWPRLSAESPKKQRAGNKGKPGIEPGGGDRSLDPNQLKFCLGKRLCSYSKLPSTICICVCLCVCELFILFTYIYITWGVYSWIS